MPRVPFSDPSKLKFMKKERKGHLSRLATKGKPKLETNILVRVGNNPLRICAAVLEAYHS